MEQGAESLFFPYFKDPVQESWAELTHHFIKFRIIIILWIHRKRARVETIHALSVLFCVLYPNFSLVNSYLLKLKKTRSIPHVAGDVYSFRNNVTILMTWLIQHMCIADYSESDIIVGNLGTLLMTSLWSEGQSNGTEPLNLWSQSLTSSSIKVELNCRSRSYCWRVEEVVWKNTMYLVLEGKNPPNEWLHQNT